MTVEVTEGHLALEVDSNTPEWSHFASVVNLLTMLKH